MRPAHGWKNRSAVLEDRNAETAELSATIKQDFEELGV
jgi:hypothetical protein